MEKKKARDEKGKAKDKATDKDKRRARPVQSFREILHPNKNRWNFVGHTRRWATISVLLVVATIAMMPINSQLRGSALNWGIDFKGGTEIRIEFAKPVNISELRGGIVAAGYAGVDVVAFGTATGSNAYLIRLKEVSTLSPEKAAALEKTLATVGEAKLVRFRFKEGSDKISVRFDKELEAAAVQAVIKGAGVPITQIRRFGRIEDFAFEATLSGVETGVLEAVKAKLGADAIKAVPSVESVGAKAGKQLRDDGIKSLMYAILLIMVYIGVRFDFRYGPGTVVAMMHDACLTVLAFAITYREFSLTTLAAILTIIGYSMNDTVVVFDRIRENVTKARDRKFDKVVNESINETMSRTVLTSMTTFASAVFMWTLGTGVISDFGFAIMIGVVVGTYSSIFVASPVLIWLNSRMAASEKKRRTTSKGKRPAPAGSAG